MNYCPWRRIEHAKPEVWYEVAYDSGYGFEWDVTVARYSRDRGAWVDLAYNRITDRAGTEPEYYRARSRFPRSLQPHG